MEDARDDHAIWLVAIANFVASLSKSDDQLAIAMWTGPADLGKHGNVFKGLSQN